METRLGDSRLVDCTSTFHICNDRGPREMRDERERERKREREKAREKRGKIRDGHMKTKVGEDGEKRGREEQQEKERRVARARVSERGNPGPESRAPPRRVGPTPTIPQHQRTDSHRVHAALTYIQPAFTMGETACRSNKRGPGHAHRARPTTSIRGSISLLSLHEVARITVSAL